MKFTGERYLPTEQGKIRLEHYHRYAAVQHIVAGKDVLDVASGEGYGSHFMADFAHSVVGVDIAEDAVQHASSIYQKSNLVFRQGSATALDFPDGSFDVVISFETIEHLAEQAKMLAEIRRVLRPGGLLVISSPNRPIYSEESGEHNEFHVKELDFNEFDELLKRQFPVIHYFGQRMLMGSVIQPIDGEQNSVRVWHDDGNELKPNAGRLTEPVYFLAVCGVSRTDLPSLNMSILYPDQLDLVKHYVGFAKWAQSLERELSERNKQVALGGGFLEERAAQIVTLNHAIIERGAQITALNDVIARIGGQIAVANQVKAERDELMTVLNRTIAEHGEEKAASSRIASEREEQTTSLNRAIAERDEQMAVLNRAVAERDEQMAVLNRAVAERDEQISILNQTMAERDMQIADLASNLAERNEWALRLVESLKEERAQLLAMRQSNSWRLTLPLREARRWITTPKRQIKRYLKQVLPLTKRFYHWLPLSHQVKVVLRHALAKYYYKLSLISDSQSPAISGLTPTLKRLAPLKQFVNPVDFAASISISTSKNPLVSVIIPIYGKCDYTLRCLASIAANPPRCPFEVIIVDDCSPDNSVDILADVNGIRLIRNEQNKGFIRSCNAGASLAQGEYLYFLNNDTEVTVDWMDELVRTFREFPGTGLVGSKLIYPDGRLQEAGGIIWQDGSAWNFGRFQDPLHPVYNYAREVDYCSGASIIVPKLLFKELGGFDEYYLPAYCEDSDLALKIRSKGLRVIYQPLSTVIHYEGITSGTDTAHGAKAYQVANSKKLYERWRNHLRSHQHNGTDVDDAKDRCATRRVLVMDHCTPTPNQDAGSVTVYNTMLLLREMGFQVTFIAEDNFLFMPEYTTSLQRAGIEVLYAPYITSVEQHLKKSGDRYDLAFLFRPLVVERHIKTIRRLCPKAKILFHTVDLHFLRMSREAALQFDGAKQKSADQMKERELAAVVASDGAIVHSTAELEMLRLEVPQARLHVFPLIMDIPGTSKSFSERRDIVFVGGYQHTPNVDAVHYFSTEIMPLLRPKLPGVRFFVVGSKPPPDIEALAAEDIIITGFVQDLTPLLDQMRVSVAPLRYGAGIKGKIGTAMAVGLPVVATPLASEGMSLTDGENILIAESSEDFADAIVNVYQNEDIWMSVSTNGLKFSENAWGAAAAWQILSEILGELGFHSKQNVRPLSLYKPTSTEPHLVECAESSSNVQIVGDDYQKKIQQELQIYKNQINVHDLPEIYHYWSNKYLAPIFLEAGFSTIAEFFSLNLLEAKSRTGSAIANFVSVGAGNCDLEVSVAKNMVNAGFKDFIFECLEINPAMLERGKEIAKDHGVLGNMRFVKADFNTWIANKKYDGVMANQSLHHVTHLEHLFDQINSSLHPDGAFVISDMIGRNGHQRWPESLEIVNKFWKELPENYKFNVLLNRLEKEYENWDCSKEGFEGVRAQDVLPLLLKRFESEKFIGFGNVIDIFVDRCFGHNFNHNSDWDRAFIDRVHEADEVGLASGKLTPTHMLAVFAKIPHEKPFFSRGISPAVSVRRIDQ